MVSLAFQKTEFFGRVQSNPASGGVELKQESGSAQYWYEFAHF
jgi:hypothetical protein